MQNKKTEEFAIVEDDIWKPQGIGEINKHKNRH
jgi:hypothetical protein